MNAIVSQGVNRHTVVRMFVINLAFVAAALNLHLPSFAYPSSSAQPLPAGSSLIPRAQANVIVYLPLMRTSAWIPAGSMMTPRSAHIATLLPSGSVLVAGGYNPSTWPESSAELYDQDWNCSPFSVGCWSATATMNSPRGSHTATLLTNGTVLVAGGYARPESSEELYISGAGQWQATGKMLTLRQNHTATLLSNGMVLVAGGHWWSSGQHSSAELYDPGTGEWYAAAQMTTPRAWHTATLLADGRVLVTGGHDGSRTLASAELYDPGAGRWQPTEPMAQARYDHRATLLPDGRVLVTGGDSQFLGSAELYDPTTGRWSTTGSMITPREGHSATLLPNGAVLVAGGDFRTSAGLPSESLASAELYDIAAGQWRPTRNMTDPHGSGHTATLLPNGQILVTGGWDESSAEIYNPLMP